MAGLEARVPAGGHLVKMPGLEGLSYLARIQQPRESVDWDKAYRIHFTWHLFRGEGERALASPRIPLRVREHALVGDRLLCLWVHKQPGTFHRRTLKVLNLKGRPLWEVPLWAPPTFPAVP